MFLTKNEQMLPAAQVIHFMDMVMFLKLGEGFFCPVQMIFFYEFV